MDKFRVSATSHWPNYLPEYVARDRGFFADEELEFDRYAPESWTQVLDDLADGSADAVLGGIWVPAMYHGRGRDYVACFVFDVTEMAGFGVGVGVTVGVGVARSFSGQSRVSVAGYPSLRALIVYPMRPL